MEEQHDLSARQRPRIGPPDDLHIGRAIELRLDAMGMTKAEFGRRIDTSRQNVNSLLRKAMPDINTLWRASVALETDFFAEATRALQAKGIGGQAPTPIPAATLHPLSADLVRAALAVVNCAIGTGTTLEKPDVP